MESETTCNKGDITLTSAATQLPLEMLRFVRAEVYSEFEILRLMIRLGKICQRESFLQFLEIPS